MNNITYVGIDWSITSPSMVIKHRTLLEEGFLDTDYMIYCVSFEKNENKYYFKKPFNFLNVMKMGRDKTSKSFTYSDNENLKIVHSINLCNIFMENIKKVSELFLSEKIIIGLEGWSYSSKGASGLDLACSQGMLRKGLIDLKKSIPIELNFYAPTEIKKFAGGGGYNKIQMVESLIDKYPDELFPKTLNDNRNLWLTAKGNEIKKPIDDITDAMWLCKKVETLI